MYVQLLVVCPLSWTVNLAVGSDRVASWLVGEDALQDRSYGEINGFKLTGMGAVGVFIDPNQLEAMP